jgi:glycosyltransferase involved in cell wall biosynthesis
MVFKDISKPTLKLLNAAIRLLLPFQVVLLHLSYALFGLYFLVVGAGGKRRRVAIGVTEVARLIHCLGLVFPSRYTCVLDCSKFYKKDRYDFGPYHILLRPFMGPILLAYQTRLCDTFVYISFTGYLADRESDLKFLKKRGKKVVMLFYGSDIRSLPKTKAFFDSIGEDSFVNYLPNLHNPLYDAMIKRTAAIADRYADLIFNWNIDQIGYLTKPAIPWPYIVELSDHDYNFRMPQKDAEIEVLHCPSHNMVKGTPLVRAAVRRLQREGYNFKYSELSGVPNHVILERLKESHIVLQEFFCLTPGILGMESLATGNAVLMSANHRINPELPEDSDSAWLPTMSWEIYDKLKSLLDNPSTIEHYAQSGRSYLERHYNFDTVQQYYLSALKERGIPC